MKPKLQTRLNNLFNQIFKPSIKRDHLAASRHLNRTLIDSPQGTKSLLKIIFQGSTAVLCIAFLSACGGGGGGGGPAVPVNRSPVFNLATSLSVAEGTTSITTISVSDPDRDPVTLSFFGPDASQLSLTANQLSFKIPPSFAAPTDADRDGTYEISISAADGLGGATTVATQITVYNRLDGRIVDGPVAGSQVFLDANANRRRDANEPTFTSDASGYFSVTDVGSVCPATGLCDALVVALGGSDTATGQELPGLALFGESLGDEDFIISPVSTLLTLSSTPAAVLTALDLNINPAAITRTDPWETATADNLAGQKLLRINQQLGLFMTSTLALNLNATAAANTIAVANAFDTLIATDALIDLTVSDTLNTLLASALGASDASTNAVAQTMADFNTVINSSTIDPRGAQASAILTTIQANFLEGIKQLSQGTQSAAQFNAQFSAQTLVTAIGADVGLPDQDSDGTPDLVDDDDDGDGVPDSTDAFPLDSTETIDTDADGTGNNTDTDDDGDGVDDTRDTNPLDSSLTPPTAVLTLDISEGFSPLLVSVNASSSIAGFGDDTITSYTWNFGDGDSSTEEATSHIYTQVGSFEISLTLTNSDGFSHTATQTVTTSLVTDPLIIEGTIFVSSSVTVDSDVNDSGSTPVSNNTRATAQFVTNPVTIGGFANEAGTGPNFDGLSNLTASGDEFDAYRINALGGEVINLRIATRGDGDLDLLLYDLDGQLIDFSVSATDNESITIPAGAATYDVVVESFAGYSNYVLSVGLDPAIASLSTATGSASVFIGDLIVQPKNDHQAPRMLAQANRVIGEQASARANARLYQFGNNITEMLAPRIRTRMLPRMATGKPTMTELKLATILAAKQLNRQNDVEYAEPNYRLTAQIEPNDEFYERQWHYQKLNLPAAWNQSTGANNVKIAVLDTGVVANHPDLEARLSADSYDFISNPSNAGDGDGVDSDARDPGDGQDNSACSTASSRSSSFHGTHVAGTIGASTNNNIGTAGVTWAGEIMNLRVLGCEGGSTFDIAQALLYAAGVDNAYGLSPTKTADVANLSLGGGPPNNVMDDAVQAARAAGMIIIAAAGNSGDATLSYPASYDGVVSVAATDLSDQRAFYSQFNAFVDIAAPGGDTSADVDGDGFPDGVLSTLANRPSSTQIDFNYGFYDGTSMATPHVAGITALMKSVNPGLTPALLDQLLSSGAITVDLGAPGRDDDFGHGRIDALLAVQAAQQLADGTIPITDTPALGVSPGRVSFGATLTERNITLFNAGTGALSITAVTPSSSRITVTPPSDSAGVGAYRLTLNREGATAGQYMESISVTSNGGNSLVNVQYEIPSINQQVAGSVGELYAFLVDWDSGEFTVQQYQSNAGQYEYRFTGVEPGVYFIIAGSDPDNDGFVGGSGEALGTYPTEDAPQLIIANQSFDQLDFRVAYEIPLEANLATQADSTNKGIPAACAPLPPERIRLPCIPRIRR
ncbi:S8 family serine peptidase [Pseudomonadales bacterium]|nr:S8 family serine peptidase [Pseudomonadales bacterium]